MIFGVVNDGRRSFVTNDTGLWSAQVKRHYRIRQQIEETSRLLKQEFGRGHRARRKPARQWRMRTWAYMRCAWRKRPR